MSLRLSVLLLALACVAQFGSALPAGDQQTELKKVQAALEELKAERQGKTGFSQATHLPRTVL